MSYMTELTSAEVPVFPDISWPNTAIAYNFPSTRPTDAPLSVRLWAPLAHPPVASEVVIWEPDASVNRAFIVPPDIASGSE